MIDSGKLRHRISHQVMTEVPDSYGQLIQSFTTIANLFAYVETLSGRELVNAKQIREDANVKVTIRYLQGLTTRDRFLFGDHFLNIAGIVDVENRQKVLEVYCTQVGTGGMANAGGVVVPPPQPLRFYMRSATDHSSPVTAAPTVLLSAAGGPWFTPEGDVTTAGSGYWTVAADASDQGGPQPLLLYATADGADPTPEMYYPRPLLVSEQFINLPLWLADSTAGSLPVVGATLNVQVSKNGGTFASGTGTTVEAGNGFYLYTPSAAELSGATDFSLVVSAPGAIDWAFEYGTPGIAST